MKTTRRQTLPAAAIGIEDYENGWGTDLFSFAEYPIACYGESYFLMIGTRGDGDGVMRVSGCKSEIRDASRGIRVMRYEM
jgi:hypothetical protein